MSARAPYLTHLISVTGAALLSLFNSAFAAADELPNFSTLTEVAAPAAVESEERAELPLPTRMKLQDETELRKAYDERRYSFDTPRQKSSERPWIDWERAEPGLLFGFAFFSAGFEADPQALLGLSLRVPLPAIPGTWAGFAEGFVSYVHRDLPFFYDNQSGNWYGAILGGDYTLYDGRFAYFRARAGILYADFNDVQELKNGIGFLLGAELGFYWVKHTDRFRITFKPEYSFSGSDSLMLLTMGLSFYF